MWRVIVHEHQSFRWGLTGSLAVCTCTCRVSNDTGVSREAYYDTDWRRHLGWCCVLTAADICGMKELVTHGELILSESARHIAILQRALPQESWSSL